jgi:hypothetical protein
MTSSLWLVFLLLLCAITAPSSVAQETTSGNDRDDNNKKKKIYCRGKRGNIPSHQTIWQTDFPVSEQPLALCEGSVQVIESTGEICVTGRVNYEQIETKLGRPVFAPNFRPVSVPGHMIAGSGNILLGAKSRFLYDYVTRYTINGISYTAGPDMTDKLLAASRGLIDQVCFDESFAALDPNEKYSISHEAWWPSSVDMSKVEEADELFLGRLSVVAEYRGYSNYSPFFGQITNFLFSSTIGITPGFVFNYIPFLGLAGIFRYFVTGTVYTADYPQSLVATDAVVDAIQIDTEWSTLMAAMEDGLFTHDERVPLYWGVIAQKVEPTENSNSCWNVTSVALNIQVPPGQGDKLDKYVDKVVLPRLAAVPGSSIGANFGTRLPSRSDFLAMALERYESRCGVELDLLPSDCYHPACTRSTTITTFTYPEQYYEFQ